MALFYYISKGKLYCHDNGTEKEIRSGVLDSYIKKVKESAARNEWKYSGSGAKFTGTYMPGADAESRVSSVYSEILCVGRYNGELIYSLNIDRANGIYKKSFEDGENEGIVISSGDAGYNDFDISGDRMVLSSSFAGESHIGVLKLGSSSCNICTEGESWDSEPVWSKLDPNKIYFCCSGLALKDPKKVAEEQPMSYSQVLTKMYTSSERALKGPSSICLLDISTGEMSDVLIDGRYDFVHPQCTGDGSVYYIRKPYRSNDNSDSLGCFADVFMLPFRLLSALFNFLNVFSAKYSGKTLSRSGDVKKQDENKLFIDGNLINAEEELKANRNRGDKNPGIIPSTWELHRLDASGNDTLVRKGVVAYRIDENTGDILISNGSAVLNISSDGKEEKISSANHVTYII